LQMLRPIRRRAKTACAKKTNVRNAVQD